MRRSLIACVLTAFIVNPSGLAIAEKEPPKSTIDSSRKTPPSAGKTENPVVRTGETDNATGGRDPLDRELAEWLVNQARHQGHLIGRADPRSVSRQVIAMLEAAASVSEECPDAYYWLYDLYIRMDRGDMARDALARYVRLTPGDDAAQLRLLEMNLSRLQTAEARQDFVRSELKQKTLSRVYESELRRCLAQWHRERRETEFAAREIEQALRLNPMNVAARELAYELFGETEPALQRTEMALQLIAMNPSQANLVWDLAEFLDRLSLHSQAQEWYNRAIQIHQRTDTTPVPLEFRHKLAVSYVSSGNLDQAKQVADEILREAADFHATRLLRAHVEQKLGLEDAAKEDMLQVARAYEQKADQILKENLADEAAEIAWFYSYHQPDNDKALALAKLAMSSGEPPPLARLAYGYALRLNGQTDEAIKTLEPLAATDQLAALELAKAQLDRGNRPQAITTLHKAATLQYSGIAYTLIADLLARYGEAAPRSPLHTKVVAALDKFNRRVFDFHDHPEEFLKFTIRFAEQVVPPAGPLNVVFRVENTGPFPVTLGEGFMSRPLIAVTACVGGEEGVRFNNYLQVMMNARPVLQPGDAVEKTVAVDVGLFREHLLRTASQDAEIEIAALFDPVYEDGKLGIGMGTIEARPIRITRSGVDTSPEAIAALIDQAKSPAVADRIRSAEVLGALRADAESRLSGSRAGDLPTDAIAAAMVSLLGDSDYRVRARAMAAVGWSKLDERLTNAAAPGVRGDVHPVVRMLAVSLFARQHGDRFIKVLRQLSRSDPSPFVRVMAEGYLPRTPNVTANRELDSANDPVP